MSEKRIVRLDPRFINTVNPRVLPWDGKEVTVESWHELMPGIRTAALFPDETRVGFVREFCADLPECELE